MLKNFTSFSQSILQHSLYYGSNIALVDKNGSRQTSWNELKTLSLQIAQYAKEQNITGIIPIVQGRTMEYIATILGLNLAGVGVAPLTKEYPQDRIEYIKNDLDTKIIADESFVEKVKQVNVLENNQFENQNDSTSLESIAFIIYTSGSTGNPKGVIYDNKCVFDLFSRVSKVYDSSNSSIVSSSSTFSFCAILIDLFLPLFNRSTVHILSDECRKDSKLLENYLIKNSINYAYIPPKMLKLLNADFPKMKTVITAGERLSNIQPRNYKIFNLYGMTETVSMISYFLLDKSYDNTPIGKPCDDVKIYLVDENGSLCDEGEICISGNNSKGYWKLSELTNKVFTKNLFSDEQNHSVLIHTGDIGKRLSDGNILFLNRKDWMVKINGQRVEPGEIESVIKKIDGVKDSIVKGFENESGFTYLCAWFVADTTLLEDDIREYLEKKLPSYMMPSFIIKIDELPVNQNGKTDRTKLLAPEVSIFKNEYVEPNTEHQKQICSAFEKILKLEKIGLNDDFFALGGNSILAISLCRELEELNLKATQVFEGRTPKGIAELMNDKKTLCCEDFCNEIPSMQESYPLSAGQTGVYYACIQNPNNVMYNIPFACRMPLSINEKKLVSAIENVVQSYSAFGVCFKIIDGEARMIKKSAFAEITTINTTESEILKIKENFVKPFDLEKGELSRFKICKTEKSIYLLIDFHHIIFDGASVKILLDAISNFYEDKEVAKEKISIFEEVLLEQNNTQTENYKKSYNFFREKLDTDLEDSLSEDFFVEEVNDNSTPCDTIQSYFDDSLNSIQLENFVRKNGITEANYFMGCFAWAFTKMLGEQGSRFCTVNSGRHFLNLENVIGMFVKTMPICIDVNEELCSKDFLLEFSKLFYQTMKNDSVPFSRLATEFGLTNDTMFVYQADSLNGFSIDKNNIEIELIETKSALSKLTVQVFRQNGNYKTTIQYRSDLYSKEKIESLIYLFKNAVSYFSKNPKLKNIPLVTESQIEKLESFNGKKANYKNCTVVDLLKEGFAKNPNKVAIVSGETKITYKELDKITDDI